MGKLQGENGTEKPFKASMCQAALLNGHSERIVLMGPLVGVESVGRDDWGGGGDDFLDKVVLCQGTKISHPSQHFLSR